MTDLIDDLDFILGKMRKAPKPTRPKKLVPLKEFARNSVYRTLTVEQQARIVLLAREKGPLEIARQLHIPESTVRNVLKRFEDRGE
jgi:DNA-binding MarR family transcriptional regulator